MSFSLAIPDWEVNKDEGQIYPPPPGNARSTRYFSMARVTAVLMRANQMLPTDRRDEGHLLLRLGILHAHKTLPS